ncbi:sialate O-acetylesterase [Candidatus Thiothrix sp. Deng01]|uniref:Sialate O-acetylesterase n=1 Tax=Candidatus Thiothrix phosphatis TaxID=3112415 RepID=A0ABU6CTD7_9GAMM|nr:sialate O-acetylesterase [Candidatus Thiothrix sp. Deng01]MEB4590086.1 sialate O-acetylesterase [Candidatus Thiothrix sp. Deng01]
MRFPLPLFAVLVAGCFQQPAGKVIYASAPAVKPDDWRVLVIGQSNAGSHAERRTQTVTGRVYAEYLGYTQPYADPIRGTTTWEWGEGSIWGLVGDALVMAGKAGTVTFTNISRGGSTVECWSRADWTAATKYWGEEQPCYDLIPEAFAGGRQYTHIVWMQGESDAGSGEADYKGKLLNVIRDVRQYSNAPFYVGVTSLCGDDFGQGDGVRAAQVGIVGEYPELNLRRGADTDLAAPLADRMFHADRCHLSWSGQQKAAQAWFGVLQ